MNPIISRLTDPPSYDVYQRKQLLNEEFYEKSKIHGLVSYIYYPSQNQVPILGHAELEIEGCSYSFVNPYRFKIKTLSQMIYSSEQKGGFPFFRFHLSVTPNQLLDIKENNLKKLGLLCSTGVAKSLSRHGKYTIPLPFTWSPLLSAIYLTSAKKLGSQRVSQIEFHRGKSFISISKGITGVVYESWIIYSLLNFSFNCISKAI
jgi:hypothetical protein